MIGMGFYYNVQIIECKVCIIGLECRYVLMFLYTIRIYQDEDRVSYVLPSPPALCMAYAARQLFNVMQTTRMTSWQETRFTQ